MVLTLGVISETVLELPLSRRLKWIEQSPNGHPRLLSAQEEHSPKWTKHLVSTSEKYRQQQHPTTYPIGKARQSNCYRC